MLAAVPTRRDEARDRAVPGALPGGPSPRWGRPSRRRSPRRACRTGGPAGGRYRRRGWPSPPEGAGLRDSAGLADASAGPVPDGVAAGAVVATLSDGTWVGMLPQAAIPTDASSATSSIRGGDWAVRVSQGGCENHRMRTPWLAAIRFAYGNAPDLVARPGAPHAEHDRRIGQLSAMSWTALPAVRSMTVALPMSGPVVPLVGIAGLVGLDVELVAAGREVEVVAPGDDRAGADVDPGVGHHVDDRVGGGIGSGPGQGAREGVGGGCRAMTMFRLVWSAARTIVVPAAKEAPAPSYHWSV